MAKTPFKFLDSYTSEDMDIFFGRDKEIEELYYKILDGNLLIVYGSSGTGKTSLIQCGLASKFQDADWMPVIVRRGNDINISVKKTLQQAALTPLKEKNTITEDIRSVYLDHFKPVYLLFDQFEELFIFGDEDEIGKFTDNLVSAIAAGLTCKFIFIIRGEYLENISVFEDKIPGFFNNRIRIERMTRKNAMRVITEPCKLFNIQVADDFPGKVLAKLGGEKDTTVELTYLQVYLDKLYKSAIAINPKNPVFDDTLLRQSGKIDDVLSDFLDEQIAKTKQPEDALIILKSFVSGEGTKKQMSISEIIDFTKSLGNALTTEAVQDDIRQLVDLRILKDKDDNGKYELRHDALAAKIFKQISLLEKELLEVRQFVINRFNDFKKRNIYLEESDIQYIRPYEKKIFLNEEQKEFVAKSINEWKRKRNRRRNIYAATLAMLLLTLTGFTVFALLQRNQAIAEKQIALQKTREALNAKVLAEKAKDMSVTASKNAMSAEKYAELQSNIANEQKKMAEEQAQKANQQTEIANVQKQKAQQQTQLAEQEKKKSEVAQTEADRLRLIALSQNIAFKSLQIKNDPQASALLSYESYLLIKENGGNRQDPGIYTALHQSLKNIDPVYPTEIHTAAQIKAIAAPPSGNTIAILANGSINNYSENGTLIHSAALNGGQVNTAYLSTDGEYAITGYDDNSIRIWDLSSGASSPVLQAHTGLVRAAAFTRDGSLYATGGRDSAVIIWSNNTVLKTINFPSRIKALAFSNDKHKILVGCEDGSAYQYSLADDSRSLLVSDAPNRIQSAIYSSGGKYIIASSSNGLISIFSAGGQPVKTLSVSASVDYLCADDGLGLLVEATSNRVIHIYNLDDLSQKPIEITDVKSPIMAMALSARGSIFLASANKATRQYFVNPEVIYQMLYNKITRNLTPDEWSNYIGKDVPYKKIIPNLP